MQWTRPEMQGEIPPPCRAHTATLVDRKLVVFGGGQSSTYYSDIWVLDTQMRRWTRPSFDVEIAPAPRRAHTTVMYKGKLWIFGGGNGEFALNDLWTLDITANLERLKWQQIEAGRVKPKPRGYHTATLVGNMMIVIGGSDGHDCFYDIWCLNLGAPFSSSVFSRSLNDGCMGRYVPVERTQDRYSTPQTLSLSDAGWHLPVRCRRA